MGEIADKCFCASVFITLEQMLIKNDIPTTKVNKIR